MEINSSLPEQPIAPKYPRRKMVLIVVAAVIILTAGFVLARGSHQFDYFGFSSPTPSPDYTPDSNYILPVKEPNRIDILVLGIRGEDDPDASDGGPLLTDSIELFSYDKVTHKASLISIPRDLYVKIHDNKEDKINTAYEYGLDHTPNGIEFVKNKFSQITGVYIDDVVVFNFSSFKQIVDALGGIDVTLDQPFTESQQWGYTFHLPAGLNHLDGQNALYYARSRYSSTDFDRSRRQQQIIFAIKDKLAQLNFLSDPIKSFSILSLVRSNVQTTISVWNIKQYLDIEHSIDFAHINRQVISTDNLVTQGTGPNNAYILLPKGGNLSGIKNFFQHSLD